MKKLITVLTALMLLSGINVFAQLRFSSKIDATAPNFTLGSDQLVNGCNKKIVFTLYNSSSSSITRSARLYLTKTDGTFVNIVWDSTFTLTAYESKEIVVSGKTLSAASSYLLDLRADNTSNLNSLSLSSPQVQSYNCSTCSNPQAITIITDPTGDCNAPKLVLNPSSKTVDSSSGNASLDVSTNQTWTAKSNSAWLTITCETTSINYSYTANTTTSPRVGEVTVSGGGISKTFTLTQAATTNSAYLDLDLNTLDVNENLGQGSLKLTTNQTWTAESNSAWLTITSLKTGTNDGTITYTYTANTTTSARIAKITVSGGGITKTFTLTQAAKKTANQGFTFTNPVLNSSYAIGKTVNVAWTSQYTGNTQFQLVDAVSLVPVLNHIEMKKASVGNFDWTIPSKVPSGTYKIKAYNIGGNNGTIVGYSEAFTISNSDLNPQIYVYKKNSPYLWKRQNPIKEIFIKKLPQTSNTLLKVLFVYPNDMDKTETDLSDLIKTGIEQANQSYTNNEIKLELVDAGQVRLVDFNESEHTDLFMTISTTVNSKTTDVRVLNCGMLLDKIKNHSDNFLDNIHILRNQYSADIIIYIPAYHILYHSPDLIGGVAKSYLINKDTDKRTSQPEQSFAIVHSWFVGSLITAHEIGHILSADHFYSGKDSKKSNHGYRTLEGTRPESSNHGWCTIMTYTTESINSTTSIFYDRLPYWSNAEREHKEMKSTDFGIQLSNDQDVTARTYLRHALGTDITLHNNEGAINSVKDIVSEYRDEKLIIKNKGTSDLIIYSITSDKNWLSVSPSNLKTNYPIKPSETLVIEPVIDWNLVSSAQSGTLTIKTNSTQEPEYLIKVNAITASQKKGKSIRPIMSVDLVALNFESEAVTYPIPIANLGGGTLNYTCQIIGNPSWLSLQKVNGENLISCQENTGATRFAQLLITSSNSIIDTIIINITQHNILMNKNISSNYACDGESSLFSVSASSPYSLSYQWYKNDTIPLLGETKNTLLLKNISSEDEGEYKCLISNNCDVMCSNSAFLEVCSTTSVKEKRIEEINISPNPANKTIKIALNVQENMDIRIFDISGKEMINKSFASCKEVEIDISTLKEGVYFVNISNDKTLNQTRKVIVIK